MQSTALGLSRLGLDPLRLPVSSVEDAKAIVLADARMVAVPSAGPPASQLSIQAMRADATLRAAEKDNLTMSLPVKARLEALAAHRTPIGRDLQAMIARCTRENTGFGERLAQFWGNHFTVALGKSTLLASSPRYSDEALRPHMLGSFRTMLMAAATHPAMLYYLDNDSSIGPRSPAGARNGRGLNENLAREMLELHSLGVDGGYSQRDVSELAKILTGWRVDLNLDRPSAGTTFFDARRHEPGSKQLLGTVIAESGRGELIEAVAILARHPATARHIARQFARSFLSESPPAAVADAMARRYAATDGDLMAVTEALVAHDATWTAPALKMRAPLELLQIAERLFSPQLPGGRLLTALSAMGQPFLAAPSPKGWPDEDDAWISSDGIKSRLDWAAGLGEQFGDRLDMAMLDRAHASGAMGEETLMAIKRAESRQQALAMLLMSPEVQRR